MSKPMDERTAAAFDRFEHVLLRAMGPELRACVPVLDNSPEVRERFTKCMTRLMQPMLVHGSQENPVELSLELRERAFLLLQNQALLKRALVAEGKAEELAALLADQNPELKELAKKLIEDMRKRHAEQDA